MTRQCFLKSEKITCTASGLPTLTVTRKDWQRLGDAVRDASKDPDVPDLNAFLVYSVCPMGIITPLSMELFRLYTALGGTSRLAKPSDYYALPAIYIDGVNIIDHELTAIRAIRGNSGNAQ